MTREAMIQSVKAMTNESDDGTVLAFLDLAANVVLRRCYPYDPEQWQVPQIYEPIQIEIAAYLLNKRGAEGETAHSENGISRSYESATVPYSILRRIVPFGATFG